METEDTSPIADEQSEENPSPFETPDEEHPPLEDKARDDDDDE